MASALIETIRFRQGNGPNWSEYVGALAALDDKWRARQHRSVSFGVLGNQPSWEDTINRAQPSLRVDSWATLSEAQMELLAPTHSFESGNALLGSIGRRSKDVRHFLESSDAVDDREKALALIKKASNLSSPAARVLGGDLLDDLCNIRGVGRAFSTRLLAIARPDCFVVVNNKSKDWLVKASGLSLTGKGRSYAELLKWVSRQEWFSSSEPTSEGERRLWRLRVALLDAFAYEPEA